MKKLILFTLLATVFLAFNGAAQASLAGSKWLFTETKGNAISFNLTFEEGGKATYKQTNGTIQGTLTWSGTPYELTLEGPFGGSNTTKMTGDFTTGKLSYRNGSGQTGEYKAEVVDLKGTKWYLTETKGQAILMTLTFEAGGKATYKQTNGPIAGTFTWSGTPTNLTIEGPFGTGSTIKMTGNMTTGKLNYSSPWSSGGKSGIQTGEYTISAKTNCKACNTNYVAKGFAQWSGDDKNTAIWLLNFLDKMDVPMLQSSSNQTISDLLVKRCQ